MYVCPTLCADPTLNINNLRQVMVSVKDWYWMGRFASGLDLPNAVCDEIQSSDVYKTEEEKKEALLLYFRRYSPKASWQYVIGALHFMKEVIALKAAKAFLKYTPGQFLIILQLIYMYTYTPVHFETCIYLYING